MTIDDMKRLDELHADSNVAAWDVAIEAAWPDVSRRLAMLEEFAARVKAASEEDPVLCSYSVGDAIGWLNVEQQKASEP